MDPTVWILIIGLVVVIAVGAWLLTRKPSAPDSGAGADQHDAATDAETRRADEVERYDVGGDHVAAGDASSSDEVEPYDQEADQREDEPVWQNEDTAGQDTATGGDVTVVEEEPTDGSHEMEAAPAPAPARDNGDREQMTYGEADTEDFASETTYADPEREDEVSRSAAPTTSGLHDGEGSENLGPEEGEGDPGEVPDEDRGHPGPQSQPGSEGTYDHASAEGAGSENVGPESGEGEVQDDDDDHGHPGPVSQGETEAVYDVPEHADDTEHDDIPSDAHAAGFTDMEDSHPDARGMTDTTDTAEEPDVVIVETVEVAEAPAQEVEPADDGTPGSDPVVFETVETEAIVVTPVDDDESDANRDVDEPLFVDEPAGDEAPVDAHPSALGDAPRPAGDDDRSWEAPRSSATGGATAASVAQPQDDDGINREPGDRDGGPVTDDEPTRGGPDDDPALTTGAAPVGESDPVVIDERDDHHIDDDRFDSEHDTDREHDTGREHDTDGERVTDGEHEQLGQDEIADDERRTNDERGDEQVLDHEPADDEQRSSDTQDVAVVEGPYGPGSAMPAEDGSHPDGYEIKGNAGSMLFHTQESPVYGDYSPDVWFDSEEAAKDAGFAHWDRKRR
ncbi:MAG: hypothetical protein WA892_03750 [Ornithinimicrobium sp.]